MPSLEYLRRKSGLEAGIKRLQDLTPGSAAYDAVYFSDIYPWVIDCVKRAFAEILEKESITGYEILVMPLSLYPEPHVLMANAISPRLKLVLLIDGNETSESLTRVLARLDQKLSTRVEVHDLAQIENLTGFLKSLAAQSSGRILVDVTGHKKSTAVRLTMAAQCMDSVDLAYLDGRGIKDHIPGSATPRPGTERILFWSGRDRYESREQSVELEESENIFLDGSATDGYRLRFRQGISQREVRISGQAIGKLLTRIQQAGLNRSQMEALGRRLYELSIPPPLRKDFDHVVSGRELTCVFSGLGCADLPLELMYRTGGFLGEQMAVRRIFAQSRSVSRATQPVTRRSMLIVEAGSHNELLPASQVEVKTLACLAETAGFPVTVLRGKNATIEEVLLQSRLHGLLHIVGHGNSQGLHLADGILSPAMIQSLSGFPGFVFLNTCESGLAAMAEAVLSAGAKTCIGSRHAIEDIAAANRVSSFYHRIFETADILSSSVELIHADSVLPYRIWGSRWLAKNDRR